MELNLIVEDSGIRDTCQVMNEKILRCKVLGFKTIALTVVINAPVVPQPPNLSALVTSQLTVYTRLTVRVKESLELYKLSKCKELSHYNLLALEPQNSDILQYICSGNAELDILTFNLSERLDYNIFKSNFKVLEDRGVCIEINYGPAQLGSALRRNIICNGQNLTEKTMKNIILSNGVSDTFRLRGPQDAKSLGVLFLLPSNKCFEAVFKNGTKAINLSKYRRNPASSAIELI